MKPSDVWPCTCGESFTTLKGAIQHQRSCRSILLDPRTKDLERLKAQVKDLKARLAFMFSEIAAGACIDGTYVLGPSWQDLEAAADLKDKKWRRD